MRLCAEARQYGFAAVCVAPIWAGLAAEQLAGGPVRVVTVIGFPHGNTFSEAKALEARRSMEQGAREFDMVMQIGALKSGEDERVLEDISAVVDAVRAAPQALVKVILETALLSDEEIMRACRLAERAGADFVKTSTGFAAHGARVEQIALMKSVVGDRLGIKASGGIRTLEIAMAMLQAGADRIGASASVGIVSQLMQAGRDSGTA